MVPIRMTTVFRRLKRPGQLKADDYPSKQTGFHLGEGGGQPHLQMKRSSIKVHPLHTVMLIMKLGPQ